MGKTYKFDAENLVERAGKNKKNRNDFKRSDAAKRETMERDAIRKGRETQRRFSYQY